jgi:hypothetical protein
LGLCFGMANHECPSIRSRRYMGSFRWLMWGGIASLWIHVTCFGQYFAPKGSDKICMMTTKLACNQAIESSY